MLEVRSVTRMLGPKATIDDVSLSVDRPAFADRNSTSGYHLGSSTCGVTVIAAIVAGGIGLPLTQAIIPRKDWEVVAGYIALIILLAMLMDSRSGRLSRKLTKGE
jgi:ABC-type phosphate/phosphonate transport system permease subunit